MSSLVSVIIPTFGKPERLKYAIDSVLVQDYSPLEIIIVDDNGEGTENQIETQKIINNYLSKVNNLKYICHATNKNGSVARNTGIKEAKGEYIALLDDDDVFSPEKITRQVQAIGSLGGEYRACYVSFSIFFPDGRKKNVITYSHPDVSLGILNRSLDIPSSSLMFTKSAWEKIGGFDESFNRHQDWEFIVRLGIICEFINVPSISMDRIICRRNSPKDPETALIYREHFLRKMKKYISNYSRVIQKEIKYIHRIDIIIEYIKNRKYYRAFILLLTSGKPFLAVVQIYKRMHNYRKNLKGVTLVDSKKHS
ncbi:glycosyltransferase family A protein [Peribacillus simplex]|uniref:glycosyltransferase family 2 protein n=1 Tax=Peribacillus simplex TaxID=1478 RepID=UPI001625F2E2|nr:glycosyltransferase family A protein [Peribacillus simplex]